MESIEVRAGRWALRNAGFRDGSGDWAEFCLLSAAEVERAIWAGEVALTMGRFLLSKMPGGRVCIVEDVDGMHYYSEHALSAFIVMRWRFEAWLDGAALKTGDR